jgi:hypothetical protein
VEQHSANIETTLKQVVIHQGFDLDTALGQKVLTCLAEVYKAVPDGYMTDLLFEPIEHELDCKCIKGDGDCDCDPDVTIRLEGLRPAPKDAMAQLGGTVH